MSRYWRARLPALRVLPRKRVFRLVIVIAGACCGCVEHLDTEQLHFHFADVTERCVIADPPDAARFAALSIDFAEGAYWIFETLRSSSSVLGASGALVQKAGDPCGDLVDLRDDTGSLVDVLPLTAEERATSGGDSEGRAVALLPTGGFSTGGAGFLYYRKLLQRDFLDVVVVGVGVARIEYGGIAERVLVNRFEHEPTLLWIGPDSGWAESVFVAPDGFAYVYGCLERRAFDPVCRVARVPQAEAASAEAYRYWDGASWTSSPDRSSVVIDRAQSVSVAYSTRRGEYVAVHAEMFQNRLLWRIGPQPFGPFSEPRRLLEATPPQTLWIRSVALHPAHSPPDGWTLVASYYSDPAGEPGLRILELELK